MRVRLSSGGEIPLVGLGLIHWPPGDAGVRDRGIVLEGYSPFRAGGLDHRVLRRIADAHQASAAQVVVRWHVQHEIVVIPKSARRERIVDNVDVAGLTLTEAEMGAIDGLGPPA